MDRAVSRMGNLVMALMRLSLICVYQLTPLFIVAWVAFFFLLRSCYTYTLNLFLILALTAVSTYHYPALFPFRWPPKLSVFLFDLTAS